MSARKKAESIKAKAETAQTPAEPTPSTSTDKGGLAELQARADQITARGFTGSEKESTDD